MPAHEKAAALRARKQAVINRLTGGVGQLCKQRGIRLGHGVWDLVFRRI